MNSVNRIRFGTAAVLAGLLLLLTVLFGLGFWQLDRAEEKRALIRLLESRKRQAPIRLDGESKDIDNLVFRRVSVSGMYDTDHQFLLENQVVDGRVGAYVLSPLRIVDSEYAVLINRGWVPMQQRRLLDSDLYIENAIVKIEGVVNKFPGVGFRLEGAEIPSGGWPALIQLVDSEYLSGVLGYPLLSYQILLNPGEPSGFIRKWKTTYPVSPEKHVAYAVQWFALAVILLMMLAWRWWRAHD